MSEMKINGMPVSEYEKAFPRRICKVCRIDYGNCSPKEKYCRECGTKFEPEVIK